MSLCHLPSFSFLFSLPGITIPSLPSLPSFTLAFSLPCPLD